MSDPSNDDPNNIENWSLLHRRVEALNQIRELMTGPKTRIPESLVRQTLAEQFGCTPEEVTPRQINFEVSGLLRFYPAIELVLSTPVTERVATPPTGTRPICEQIKELQNECRMTAEDIAQSIGIEPRSVFRHLSGEALPRKRQIAAYEKLFSEKTGRKITLEIP